MLAIRMKRFGKTHFATYRVVVQDAAKHPSSGKVVAYVGNYNPHTKTANLDQEQIEKYLSHGAQPSPRVVKLLKEAKIKLPAWVKEPNLTKARATRNSDKLRKHQPAQPAAETKPAEAVATETTATAAETAPTAEPVETPTEPETTAAPEAPETEPELKPEPETTEPVETPVENTTEKADESTAA